MHEQPSLGRDGVQGWKQFLAAKQDMLFRFELAQRYSQGHIVRTWHGRVAESVFRDWLAQFLPRRFGVTSGYIISQGRLGITPAPHYDVVIYDQLAAPVLWVERSPDSSQAGTSMAIPAEFVRGVIEVKSTLDAKNARESLKKLNELRELVDNVDSPEEMYPKYLPRGFVSASVFFTIRKTEEFRQAVLDALVPTNPMPEFMGALLLSGEGLPVDTTGRVQLLRGVEPIHGTVGRRKESLIKDSPLSVSKQYAGDAAYYGAMLMWYRAAFAEFAFQLVALLNGSYQPGRIASWHGMVFRRTR